MAIDYEAKIKALEAEQAELDDSAEAKTRQLEITKALAEANRDYAAASGASIDELAEQTRAINVATDALKEHTEAQTAAKKSQDDFSNALGRTIKTFTGVTDASDTLVGSFFKLAGEQDGATKVADKMKEVFEETFTALNIGTSIVRKLGESTFAMAKANDQATAAFNAASGAAGIYDSELVALQMSNIQNGISTTEMAQSYAVLQSSLSGFGVMAESERMRLGELGAQFAQVGVSGADFAGTLQTMTRGFGMSTRAATGMQEEAMALAQTLGKDVGTVLSEMNAALPQLASYGSDAVDMFFDLEKQAQRTGLAVGDLISIAGNYRTFDSAAEAAGNLNAVLGTQLFSTMGLLESQLEGPEAVIEYMSGVLSDSIGDWDSLNTFQKEAVANAAGMNVEEMNHLMNQESLTREEKKRAKSLEETMAAGRDLWQEMTIFAQNFAVAVTPIMNFMVSVFQDLNKLIALATDKLGPFMNVLKIVGGLMASAFAVTGITSMITLMGTLTTAIWTQTAALYAKLAAMGPVGWGIASAGLLATGGFIASAMSKRDSHAEGTDSTSGRMALVGEEGPELLVPPPNSAVVNNTTMTALAEQGAGGGDNNAQVVAAVQSLGVKLDTMIAKLGGSGDLVMKVGTQEIGRVINQHLGEPGSAPLRLKTT